MEDNIGIELADKARQAKSPEELTAMAKEYGMEFTGEEAAAYFAQLTRSGELSDEELENVAGGGCYKGDRLIVTSGYACDYYVCPLCGAKIKGSRCMKSKAHYCKPADKMTAACCNTCKFCTKEKGMWICNHPEKKKK